MSSVKFCDNNFAHGTEEVMNRLKKTYNDLDVSVESCLGYCGDCANGPYALVDDELVQADTPEELYNVIVSAII